jgi:lysophospholipase L1-like esterase
VGNAGRVHARERTGRWAAFVVASCLVVLAVPGAIAQRAHGARPGPRHWVDAWAASFLSTTVNGSVQLAPSLDGQTYRANLRTTLGGPEIRVKFSNAFATNPLTIGAAHVAIRDDANTVLPWSDRALTFHGEPGATLPPGADAWSDPVELDVGRHTTVSVSVYVPGPFQPTTFHPNGLHTNYISRRGNYTAEPSLPLAPTGATTRKILMVSGLQVWAPTTTRVAVMLGDSITDGVCAQNDGNDSYPDVLAGRLPVLPSGAPFAVVNMGIASNRVVASDAAGPSAVHRLATDVLARPNVRYLLLLEGINDISYEHVDATTITDAYAAIVARAHAAGIEVFGATLLPIGGSAKYSPANETTRQAVNAWVRAPGHFDRVLDFDAIVREPGSNPPRIEPSLTCDAVHPNAAGYAALGSSVPRGWFR